MRKKVLSYEEPMYSTYHALATPGVAMKQNKTSDIWYYNNTVNWSCTRRFSRRLKTPEMMLLCGEISNIPILDKVGISIRFVRNSIVDIIKTMIDDGFYVFFNGVDDYYVKGKCWYKEQHFNHEGMIIGYDDEKSTFILAGYDQRWIYTVFETPQECFVEGMNAICNKGKYGMLYAIRVKDEPQELDIKTIYKDLDKYLSTTIEDYPLTIDRAVYGIVVYDFLCMYLDKLMDGSIQHYRRDRRIFRLVWEHKKCMLGRINAVENLCGWNNELSSAYEEIVKLADITRFIYSKFSIKYSSKHLEKIQVNLIKMKNLEKDLLGVFFKKLEKEIELKSQKE